VIVQPHILKDKGTVRLRNVLVNGGLDNTERLVLLENLAWTIKELSPATSTKHDDPLVHEQIGNSGQTHNKSFRDGGNKTVETSIECVYILNDQFFDRERPISKSDNARFKSVIKTIRSVTQRAQSFVQSMVDPGDGSANDLPVFVVTDVSFWCLRDFGSNLMKKAATDQCSSNAYLETIDLYPTHKRSLKTLAAAIDSYMKRNGFWQGPADQQSAQEVILLLYSKLDDKFDMVTLTC
jgi:hypothetical protein